jgi:hypothetical protein
MLPHGLPAANIDIELCLIDDPPQPFGQTSDLGLFFRVRAEPRV